MMGSGPDKEAEYVHELSYIPTKLSLLTSRQSMSPEITPPPPPPPKTTISVPFKWEEAPGKPRHYHTQSEPRTTTLELPPRLLFLEANNNNIDVVPSPTTVLDGPYVGRAMSFTSSYRTPRASWNSSFGSTRWSGFRKINKEEDEGSFDFSDHCNAKTNKGKITRGGGSLLSLSKAKSHLWVSD